MLNVFSILPLDLIIFEIYVTLYLIFSDSFTFYRLVRTFVFANSFGLRSTPRFSGPTKCLA